MADNPEPYEIIQMARYLEIDPIYDSKYLWIANEAVVNTASLPEGWEEHTDEDGNTYFYNSTTHSSPDRGIVSRYFDKAKDEYTFHIDMPDPDLFQTKSYYEDSSVQHPVYYSNSFALGGD